MTDSLQQFVSALKDKMFPEVSDSVKSQICTLAVEGTDPAGVSFKFECLVEEHWEEMSVIRTAIDLAMRIPKGSEISCTMIVRRKQ